MIPCTIASVRTESDDGGFDVILFDLGGVLMDFTGLERLAEMTGEPDEAAVRSRWAASRWMGAFGRGECDAAEFGDGFVREWALRLTSDEFLAEFARWPAGPFPGSLELLDALDGTVPMGCLSDTNPIHWQLHLDRWGVVDHFDWTFVSHELGMTKPDPAVFDHVVRVVGADAGRILFLDDADANVRAARRAGMRAEQTRGSQEVRDALRSLLPGDSPAGRAVRGLT